MDKEIARIDGWEVLQRPDGSYGVYDCHGMLDGPYGTPQEAMAAALRLPVDRRATRRPPTTGGREVESRLHH